MTITVNKAANYNKIVNVINIEYNKPISEPSERHLKLTDFNSEDVESS